jgi:hypothetical protein
MSGRVEWRQVGYYTWTRLLWSRSGIKGSQLLAVLALGDACGNGRGSITVRQIAGKAGVAPGTVTTGVSRARSAGWIRLVRRGKPGHASEYILTAPVAVLESDGDRPSGLTAEEAETLARLEDERAVAEAEEMARNGYLQTMPSAKLRELRTKHRRAEVAAQSLVSNGGTITSTGG